MRELQQALEDVLTSLPRAALAVVLKRKLQEAGIKAPKKVVQKLIDHLLSGSDAPFVIDRKDDRNIVLDLTDDDIKQIDAAIERTTDITSTVTEDAAETISKKLLKWLKAKWPEQHALEKSDLSEFRVRLEERWGAALDLLRMMLAIARELHEGGVTKDSVLHRTASCFCAFTSVRYRSRRRS